jgi:ABC-type branched-subunit amino acid transport system substrate-binding protein
MLFSGGSTSMIAYPPKKYVFHAADGGNTRDVSICEIDYFVKERKAKRIGIIYQADPFGETILKEQGARLKFYNLTHAIELPFNKGDTDFTSQLVKDRGANLEILL